MAKSSTKKGTPKKAAPKKAASPAKNNGSLGKPVIADLVNGILEVRYDDNSKFTYPISTIEPQLHRFLARGARVEDGKVILTVRTFDIALTPARLQALSEPAAPPTKDSLPARIMKVYDNFGDFLEKQLNKRNWGNIDLEEKTGIPKYSISGYKRGATKPTMEGFFKILKAFNIKLEDL